MLHLHESSNSRPDLDFGLQCSKRQGQKELARCLPQVPIREGLLHAGLAAQELGYALHASMALLCLASPLQGEAGSPLIHLTEACLADQVQVVDT